MNNERKFYLVLSEDRREFQRIIGKHCLPVENSILIYKDKERYKLYEGLLKLKYSKFEATYKRIKLIPDLWLWCYKLKVESDYEKEKMITMKLYDPIRWKEYNKSLHEIANKYHPGPVNVKYEMIKIFKLFRKLLLAGIDIGTCLRMIDFFYNQESEGYIYPVNVILDRYLQVYNHLNPERFNTPLKDILNIKDPVNVRKSKNNKKISKMVKDGIMHG